MIQTELQRLINGPPPGKSPAMDVRVTALCPSNAPEVLNKARGVLVIILQHSMPWPDLSVWRSLLPPWLLATFQRERTKEEAEAYARWWDGLPWEEKRKHAQEASWRLSNWISCFEPDGRQWLWWDASVQDIDTLHVDVEVEGWPVPLADLEWLLLSAGASEVRVLE